jgi:hypothetical protein
MSYDEEKNISLLSVFWHVITMIGNNLTKGVFFLNKAMGKTLSLRFYLAQQQSASGEH